MRCAVVTVVVLILRARADWARDVVDYSAQIDALISADKNVIDVYDDLAKRSASFLKLGWPIGAMLAAGVNAGFTPDTDELAAFKHLHSVMWNQFKATNLERTDVQFDLMFDRAVSHYFLNVTDRLQDLRRVYSDVTHPERMRQLYKSYFIDLCLGPSSKPMRILKAIEDLFVKGCNMSTKNDVANLMKVDRALWNLQTRTAVSMRFESLKHEILGYVHRMKDAEVRALVDAIGNLSNDQGLETISKGLRQGKSPLEQHCIPQLVTDVYVHERIYVDSAMRSAANDLLSLEILTSACGNISTNGDRKEMLRLDTEFQKEIEFVATFIRNWLSHTQEVAWPELYIEKAKQAMGTVAITPKNFNLTAQIIQKNCENIGEEKIDYQVLVLDTKRINEFWFVRALGGTHLFFSSNGVNVHIIRFDTRELNGRALTATRNFESNRMNITSTIEYYKNGHYADAMLDKLQNNYNLVAPDAFHTMIVLRDAFEFSRWASINVGKAFLMAVNSNASSTVEFFENDYFPFYAFAWNLYAFV